MRVGRSLILLRQQESLKSSHDSQWFITLKFRFQKFHLHLLQRDGVLLMVIVIKCMESIPNTRKLLQYIPPKKSTTQKYPAGYGICDHSQYRVHPGKLRPGCGNSNSFSFSPLMGGKKPPTRLTWWNLIKSTPFEMENPLWFHLHDLVFPGCF